MKIIKRNGTEVGFDPSKITCAVQKANVEIEEKYRLTETDIDDIANKIQLIAENSKRSLNVEEIQDMVEEEIMEHGAYKVARAYITYRYKQSLKRKANTTDETILSIVELDNEEIKQENSNKNPIVNSTQRDYIAGETSKDITRRRLLPKEIIEAHDQGIIHFHDTDYFLQRMHNCFHRDTEFVTNLGVLKFGNCNPGQKVLVKDMYGIWREATVQKYGKQKMNTITFKSGPTIKTLRATTNHRWILNSGEVTTDLKVGDKLWNLIDCSEEFSSIKDPYSFCLGFILGDGTNCSSGQGCDGVKIRLCGEKKKYMNLFISAGYKLSTQEFENGDIYLNKYGRSFKQEFIKNHLWYFLNKDQLIDLFRGYYAADGSQTGNTRSIATANPDIAQMIRDISALSGFFISSENHIIRDTPYKENAELYNFHFIRYQQNNFAWTVIDIDSSDYHEYDAWCVEEPITHSFTLNNGMVTGNCALINLEDMLQNGTCISDTLIEKPHSFSVACNIATQAIAQVASNQYGGQSINLSHLAPFVEISRQKFRKQVKKELTKLNRQDIITEEEINSIAEERVKEEISRGVQIIQYQILTLLTTNGQTPFITIFMYLGEVQDPRTKADLAMVIEEVIKQRYQGVKNEKGVWITPAFPKLIYVLEEDNIHEDSKYFYLTKMAAMCTAKRMVPDYISEKKMKEIKDGNCFSSMGCRSFLAPWFDENGKVKFWGRFNMGVVTINLVDVACSSHGDMDKFWKIFEDRLQNLCFPALMCRYNRLKGTPSDVAPILWQHGALARLKKGETIDKLLVGGYASISLGYAGLAECVKYMTGKSHTNPEATPFALDVMKYMNKKVNEWKDETNLGFSIYGTPIESTTYKFAKCLQNRFGIIPGVTDKNYITNSYHVHVTEKIDAFTKLKFESQFQDLSSGGAISYVEVPNMQDNIDAVIEVMEYIYDNIMYAELNTKSDYCECCGYDGEIKIVTDDDGKLVWECPKCGNRDQNKMSVARRTCGLTVNCPR